MLERRSTGNSVNSRGLVVWARQVAGMIAPVLGTFILWRGALWLWGFAAVLLIDDPAMGQAAARVAGDADIIEMWFRWDALWYLEIAEKGYSFRPDAQSSAAFFPLFPLVGRVLGLVTGSAAGLLIAANVSLLVACALLWERVRTGADAAAADRAVAYLLAFPAAFFLSAPYSESLYLALVLWFFRSVERKTWWHAGVSGALASAVRPPGVLLPVFGAVALWQMYRRRERIPWAGLAALAAAPLGLAAYMAYLWQRFSDPWAFLKAQQFWARGGGLAALWDWLKALDGAFVPRDSVNWQHWWMLACALGVLALVPAIWRRQGPALALYTCAGVAVPLATGTLDSLPRLCAVLFPIYIVLAQWGAHARFDRALVYVFAGLQMLLFGQFVNWYWMV